MSGMNFDFGPMHATVVEMFGRDGTVVRGADAPVPVTVVIDEGVHRIGEFGQVVGLVSIANFLVEQWRPRQGDELTVGAQTRSVESVQEDDGHVARAVLHG